MIKIPKAKIVSAFSIYTLAFTNMKVSEFEKQTSYCPLTALPARAGLSGGFWLLAGLLRLPVLLLCCSP
ncbi:MAG: hypothetical protein WBW41_18375, partial [Verrucomicrobiia bacterium]